MKSQERMQSLRERAHSKKKGPANEKVSLLCNCRPRPVFR